MTSTKARRQRGHALCRGTKAWVCKCGHTITVPGSSRAIARDIYRFHLLDVWMKRNKGCLGWIYHVWSLGSNRCSMCGKTKDQVQAMEIVA